MGGELPPENQTAEPWDLAAVVEKKSTTSTRIAIIAPRGECVVVALSVVGMSFVDTAAGGQ